MQNIINNTPFAAGKTLTKDARTGDDIYIIAVKATFDIETNGLLSVSKEQADVLKSPVYFGDECASSVEYPPDLSIQKERVDLIINASAHTPDHEPVCELTATVLLNDWGKELKVTGDRYWKNDFGRMGRSTPESFVKIPIVYENAFGGVDRSDDKIPVTERITFGENPVGTGFAVKSKYLEGMRLPRLNPQVIKPKRTRRKINPSGLEPLMVTGPPEQIFPEPVMKTGTHNGILYIPWILIPCFTSGHPRTSSLIPLTLTIPSAFIIYRKRRSYILRFRRWRSFLIPGRMPKHFTMKPNYRRSWRT